jgi:hypothetical protein
VQAVLVGAGLLAARRAHAGHGGAHHGRVGSRSDPSPAAYDNRRRLGDAEPAPPRC